MDYYKRLDIEDPNRCDGTTGFGPCLFPKVPGSHKCYIHGGALALKKAKAEATYKLRLQRVDPIRIGQKSLDDELQLVQATLRAVTHDLEDDVDPTFYVTSATDLLKVIRTLGENVSRLQKQAEEVLELEDVLEYIDALPLPESKRDVVYAELKATVLTVFDPNALEPKAIYNLPSAIAKHTSDKPVTLQEEIAVARSLLQELLNRCNDVQDLLNNLAWLLKHVNTINDLVVSRNKIERNTRIILDLEAAEVLKVELDSVLKEHLTTEEYLELANEGNSEVSRSDEGKVQAS